MSSQHLDEERIFHIARKLPDAEARSEYLRQICAGDRALRDRVESLLEVHEQQSEFLKSSPEAAPTAEHASFFESPGTSIGRYHLREQIGEGGMGVVFVAEQQRPLQRKVALKVIKPGMDSKAVIARFEAERQALALMDHPNIAKVLDAGTTESGRPYFVMELVRGIPITDYCDQNKLTIRERLELFIQACQAIQHAHQKGIIHRDVKPGNVLVTLHDGKPVPKVIDFGVAKALNQRLTERTIYTNFAQVVGTPLYMSPEQAELSGLDIDTRSDVYSLGVLLYELLTGTTPFDWQQFEQAAYDEIRRIIREQEPPKASTRISSLGATATAVAEHRKTDLQGLQKAVRGDLDWIVMKALEKDRSRRYESAAALGVDVERYRCNEPIEARPPSSVYRVRKLASRNKAALTTLLLLVLSMFVGLAGTTWQAVRASRNAHDLQQSEGRVRREAEAVKHANKLLAEERSRLKNLLSQLQERIIEHALLQAVAGDVEEVQRTISGAGGIVDTEWLKVLEAAAYIHAGENRPAIERLSSVVKSSPNNIPAVAMLSIAYVHEGEWDQGTSIAQHLEEIQPRTDFEDLDLLFRGYGFFYVDCERSVELLQGVLQRHPSWIVARAILAAGLAHLGEQTGDISKVELALRESSQTLAVARDNRYVALVGLFACNKALEFHLRTGPNGEDVQSLGIALARQLEQFPDYSVGNAIRAQFYTVIEDHQKATDTWRQIVRCSAGFWVSAGIGHLYQQNPAESFMLADQLKRGDPEIDIARAYLLAGMPTGWQRATEIYDRTVKSHRSTYIRFKAIQILLLLGERNMAATECSKWIESGDIDTPLHWWNGRYAEALKMVANIPTAPEFSVDSSNNGLRFFATFQKALIAIAEGNREVALAHLQQCDAMVYVDVDIEWARAFLARLNNDDSWPQANEDMQN